MEYILTEKKDRIHEIILNRPDKRNALSSEFVKELREAVNEANDDDNIRVLLISARGKAFSAGADLAYLQQLQNNSYEENLADSSNLMELFHSIYYHNKIVIAQVEGHALAGGCGLATVCDFVFSVPEAKFGYTEVKIGFIPAIVMFFLLRKIGEAKSRELLLTGKLINAEEAKSFGLINEIIAPEQIGEYVRNFALGLCKDTSPQAVALTRKMIADIQHLPARAALEYAAAQNAHARATNDCKKGIGAFLNKQDIVW
jgi:methylglutaconyl-CoA hydratase